MAGVRSMLRRAKVWARQRITTILVFAYGIVVGTSAPILLTRCVSGGSGGCGSCGGFCGLALGVLPLLLFLALRGRARQTGQRVLAQLSRAVRKQHV